jgi:hypothetical protein
MEMLDIIIEWREMVQNQIENNRSDKVYQYEPLSFGSRTRDRAKAEPGLVKKIADPAIFNQSSGKSVSCSHVDCVGQAKHLKSISLLHLTSKG